MPDLSGRGRNARQLLRENNVVIWRAELDADVVIGAFNLDKEDREVAVSARTLDREQFGRAHDLWTGDQIASDDDRHLVLSVQAHGGRLIQIQQ